MRSTACALRAARAEDIAPLRPTPPTPRLSGYDCSSQRVTNTHQHTRHMPEFEEENVNASQSQSYTPSTDASNKPRTRRRSGGFKTEAASVSNANIGEVSAADALKEEKLSGNSSPSEPRAEREDRPRRERSERKPREPRDDREPRGDREPRQKREPREPREPRTDANPQPSAETLAAIASVEAKINERRTERDTRRAERDKNRPAKAERTERKPREPRSSGNKPAPKKKGLLASILSIFGLGPKEEPAKKSGGNRGGPNKGRDGRPQGKGGNRGEQNRGRGGQGGNRGGQNRGRGGNGGNRNNRRSNENSES